MLIVSYDFRDDKRRTKFAKFLKKYGHRLQYSVFELKNSRRILQNVIKEVEYKHKQYFTSTDSILIYQICQTCERKILRYGCSVHEEEELVIFE